MPHIPSNKYNFFIAILLLATVIISFRFINSKNVSFSDELLFEEASFNMAATGNLLTPILHNKVWLEKPPLYFWLTAPVFHVANLMTPNINIFSLNQSLDSNNIFNYPWIRRFWTEIAALICVYFTCLITKLLSNKNSALLSGLILLTSPYFFFTLPSASLDISFTATLTVSLYLYIMLCENPEKQTSLKITLLGTALGLGILFRSALAFTPFAVILTHQLLNPKKRLSPPSISKILAIAILIALPWHLYQFIFHQSDFINTYLVSNLIGHGIKLTPGYEATTPLYYLKIIFHNPWFYLTLPFWYLLSVDITNLLRKKGRLLQLKPNAFIRNNFRLPPKNQVIILWIIIPTLFLSFAPTRHSWYLIQTTPAVAILSAQLAIKLYESIRKLKNKSPLYLFKITLLTFTLVPIVTLIAYPTRNAPLIEILNAISKKLPPQNPIYELPYPYFPNTLLYHPHQVRLITLDQLKISSQDTKPFFVFIGKDEISQAIKILPNLELVTSYKPRGNLYKLP